MFDRTDNQNRIQTCTTSMPSMRHDAGLFRRRRRRRGARVVGCDWVCVECRLTLLTQSVSVLFQVRYEGFIERILPHIDAGRP